MILVSAVPPSWMKRLITVAVRMKRLIIWVVRLKRLVNFGNRGVVVAYIYWHLSDVWLDTWEFLLVMVIVRLRVNVDVEFLADVNWSLWCGCLNVLEKFRVADRWLIFMLFIHISSDLRFGWNSCWNVIIVVVAVVEALLVWWNMIYQMRFGLIEIVLGTLWHRRLSSLTWSWGNWNRIDFFCLSSFTSVINMNFGWIFIKFWRFQQFWYLDHII